MIEEVSRNEMLSTIHYMTEHFPYRLAGSPCEAAASRYVTERLKQYGLEVENKEFYTYNSDPMYSKVTVLEPEMEIDSLPCAHIRATKPEGEIFELIYVGNGDYAAYKDIDVTGKMVLVEVSLTRIPNSFMVSPILSMENAPDAAPFSREPKKSSTVYPSWL